MESAYYSDTAFAGILVIVYLITMLISLGVSILTIVALWKVFAKAGKPGWAAIIPFYNTYVLCEISLGSGWLFLLSFIPCVNFFFSIYLYYKLSTSFGYDWGFAIGLILIPYVFLPILGFGKSEYIGCTGSSDQSYTQY